MLRHLQQTDDTKVLVISIVTTVRVLLTHTCRSEKEMLNYYTMRGWQRKSCIISPSNFTDLQHGPWAESPAQTDVLMGKAFPKYLWVCGYDQELGSR